MSDDIYTKLQQHFDTLVLGAPTGDGILEILKIRFTREQAEAALLLGPLPLELSVLAQRSSRSTQALREVLDQMADNATVLKTKVEVEGTEKEMYALLPTAIGLSETSFAKGMGAHRAKELAHYWRRYYASGWRDEWLTPTIPLTRVIPVRMSVETRQQVFSYEQAAELLKQHEYLSVLHCGCRVSAALEGADCGHPTEVCLHFGELARFLVEKGYARQVSHAEALEILDETEKAGLVHMVANSKAMGAAMCSCCSCCCVQLRAVRNWVDPKAVAKSRFAAQVSQHLCVACEACGQRCQVTAIAYIDGVTLIDGQKCIGCGLCVTTCFSGAISLQQRPSFQEPVGTILELAKAFIEGKGKQRETQ